MGVQRWAIVMLALLAAPGSLDAQTPLVRQMSIDELRACGVTAVAIQQRRQAIITGDVVLTARGKALAAESSAIDAARKRVNLRDAKAVAAFNARVARSRAAFDSYNAGMASRRQAVTSLNADSDLFNVNCADRPYDQASLAQLPEASRLAIAAYAHSVAVPMLPTALGGGERSAGAADGRTVVLTKPDVELPPDVFLPPAGARLSLVDLKAAAGRGDAEAQFQLGMQLHDGVGMPRDPSAALEWLLKAAAQHHALAAFSASRMLSEGDDVPVDKSKALLLLRDAAAAGQPDAEHNLAIWYADISKEAGHMQRAHEWMTRAADHGDPESQFVLAGFDRGINGLPRDLAASVTRLRQSADQGFRPAQLDLGHAYAKGDGIARDPVEALKWYRLAAGLTKIDASQGCGRRLMLDSTTRSRAAEAATALAGKLSAYEADKAVANAEAWAGSAHAKKVGGCPRAF